MLAVGDVDFDAAPAAAQEVLREKPVWKRGRAGKSQKWGPLLGTEGELLKIQDAFSKAVPNGKLRILREAQATEAEVRRQAPQFDLLHLATHGFFAEEEVKSATKGRDKDPSHVALRPAEDAQQSYKGTHPGLLSGLVLAGANKPQDDDDGVLTALKVAELDLSRTELAVLSAVRDWPGRSCRRRGGTGPAAGFSDCRCSHHHHQFLEGR